MHDRPTSLVTRNVNNWYDEIKNPNKQKNKSEEDN